MSDVSDMSYRVGVVCWGNICRSPMGEFILRAAIKDAGLADLVEVDSRGTSTEELGNGMDRRAVEALHRGGIPDTGFAHHRARLFHVDDFARYDLILAADHIHENVLRRRAPDHDVADKIVLVRSFDPAAVAADDLGMADPWYGEEEDFDVTLRQIEAAVPGILLRIRTDLGQA